MWADGFWRNWSPYSARWLSRYGVSYLYDGVCLSFIWNLSDCTENTCISVFSLEFSKHLWYDNRVWKVPPWSKWLALIVLAKQIKLATNRWRERLLFWCHFLSSVFLILITVTIMLITVTMIPITPMAVSNTVFYPSTFIFHMYHLQNTGSSQNESFWRKANHSPF